MPKNVSYLRRAPKASSQSVADRVKSLLADIKSSMEREKKWKKDAERAVCIYEGDQDPREPFNILYSNSETLSPAVYNSTPRPDVRTRYRNENPIARAAAQLCQAYLTYFCDSGDPVYPSFDELNVGAVTNAIVPGRGVVWYKYDADVKKDTAGSPQEVTYESVCGEIVPYDQFLIGYGRSWQQVPWVARIHFYTRDEATEEFGPDLASKLTFSKQGDEKDGSDEPIAKGAEGVELAVVFEIWIKATRKVCFVSAGVEEYLRETDDPLSLEGFYPTPEPLQLFRRISSNVPQTLYSTYENQALELNRVTRRIQKLIEAMKVRGFYDSRVDNIAKALEQEDNVLLPAENLAQLTGMGGKLEDAVYTFPIEKLVPVIQQLYVQREQIKQVIYEITGISDILRGASVASETATAQTLKDRWGSLRLKRFQKEVARYVRDSLRIVAEIAFSKLSPETILASTGIKLPSQQDKMQAQAMMQQAQTQGMPPPPELQATLQTPSVEEVFGMLQSDLIRRYNVDIETNSTVDAEATEDKADIAEFMQSMAQFFSGIAPLIENQTMPFEAAKAMLLAIVKRYRFGREVEEQLSAMVPPQPATSPEELKKIQAEIEKKQADLKKQEEGLKDQEAGLKDIQRDIETQRKEFAADVKVAKAEAQAAQAQQDAKVTQQNAQFEATQAKAQADSQMRETEFNAAVGEKEMGLQSMLREIEEAQRAAETNKEAVASANSEVKAQVTQALSQLEAALSGAIEKSINRKVRARKDKDGSWIRETVSE